MKRFWVSWWTSNYPANGVDSWPETLKIWVSGSRGWMETEQSLCAVIDTDKSEVEIWAALKSWFPDLEPRFCSMKPPSFQPGDRFPGYNALRTTIKRKPSPGMAKAQAFYGTNDRSE